MEQSYQPGNERELRQDGEIALPREELTALEVSPPDLVAPVNQAAYTLNLTP